jgi:hypothetical protein
VADGCVADRRVFCKQDPRKKQRLAFGSPIDLNRRSQAAVIKIQRGGKGKVGKIIQELTVDLGVVGIVEGKLGGGGSTRYRAGAVRFQGRRRCSGDWSAGR